MTSRMWTVEIHDDRGRWHTHVSGLRGYCQGWLDAQRERRRALAWRLVDPHGRVVEELPPSPPPPLDPLSARLDGGVVTVLVEVGGRLVEGSASAANLGLPDALSVAARRALDAAREGDG